MPDTPLATTGEQNDIPLDAAQAAEGERYRAEDDRHIVARVKELRDGCMSYAANRHATIRRMRRLYADQHDFTKKATWQSKVWSPEVFGLVGKAVALYESALTTSERWFSVEDEWAGSPHRERVLEQIQRRNLVKAGFYELMGIALQEGFIGGTIPLVVGVDSRERFPQVSLTLWDPLDVARDWSGRDRFLILRSEVDAYQLRAWAEQGLYEEERVEAALRTSKPMASNSPLTDEKVLTCTCDIFWGDLPAGEGGAAERGKLLGPPNAHCVVINEEVLLRPLVPNPWVGWGKAPVIFGHPLRSAFRPWPGGLVEHVSGLARMITEVLNALLDDLMYATVPVMQYDAKRINKADLQRGLYPGKLIGGDMEGGAPLISPAVATRVPVEAFSVVALLDKKIQAAFQVTEHTSGNPGMSGSRDRATATEIRSYMGQSLQLVNTMAKDLQVSCFEPLLDCILAVFAQAAGSSRGAWMQPEMVQALGPEAALILAMLEDEVRAEVLTRGVRHKAKGISGAVSASEDMQKLMAFGMAAKQDAEMWAMVKKRNLLEKLAALNRQDPDTLLYTEEEVQQRMAERARVLAPPPGAPVGLPPGAMPGQGGPPIPMLGSQGMPPGMPPRPMPAMPPAKAGVGG